MRQSTIIFGVLLFAFLMYITLRGQLPAYLALFSARAGTAGAAASGTSVSATSSVKDALSGASDTLSKVGSTLNTIVGDISFDHGKTWTNAGTMAEGN